MQARDVMTTNVVIVQASTPIADIARILRTLAISGVPVFEGDTLVGIVKEVDLIARHARPHYPRYLPLLDAQIPLGGQREYQEMVRRILGTTAPASSTHLRAHETPEHIICRLLIEQKK